MMIVVKEWNVYCEMLRWHFEKWEANATQEETPDDRN